MSSTFHEHFYALAVKIIRGSIYSQHFASFWMVHTEMHWCEENVGSWLNNLPMTLKLFLFVPRFRESVGTFNLIRPSVCLFVRLSQKL